jgi:hypothetical protein
MKSFRKFKFIKKNGSHSEIEILDVTVYMEWHHQRPLMKVCPICGKNIGLSSNSLKLHLQKPHWKISSGSVDSAMTMEIQKEMEVIS